MHDLTDLFELDNLGEAFDYIEDENMTPYEDREED
jgi:hypothetical protein